MKFLTFAFVILGCLQIGYALKCYLGSSGTQRTVSCTGSCMKTVASVDDDSAAAYACSPLKMDDGCRRAEVSIISSSAEVCYCSTDLCNASGTTILALPLLLLPVLVKVLL